jgi:hypothetical protein
MTTKTIKSTKMNNSSSSQFCRFLIGVILTLSVIIKDASMIEAFSTPTTIKSQQRSLLLSTLSTTTATTTRLNAEGSIFEVEVDVPPSNSGVTCTLKFGSILSVPSEIVEVRYKLPFGLNVEPKKNFAVVTQGNTSEGNDSTKEQTGDVLRYTSQWTMGLPDGDGLAATAGFFSGGGVTWRCTMFDVMKAKDWNRVVEALTSNVPARTDEVVLLFERPLEPPPELQ